MRHGTSVLFLIVSAVINCLLPLKTQAGEKKRPLNLADQQTKFLLFNTTPNGSYHITKNAVPLTTTVSSTSGVLSLVDMSSTGDILIFLQDGIDPQPPSQPTGLIASADQSGCAHLSWTANPEANITHYIIYYGTASVALGQAPGYTDSLTLTGVNSQALCGLADGTWYFAVRAVNGFGLRSPYSQEASAELSTVVAQPPVPPQQLSVAETSPGCVTAGWQSNSEPDVSGYQLYYGGTSVAGGQAVVYSDSLDVGNTTSREVCNFETGSYYFAVKAYNLSGQFSGYSAEHSLVITGPDLEPPQVSIVSPGSGEVGVDTVWVMVTATDDMAMAGVRLQLDGIDTGPEDTTEPFELSWVTGTADDGPHSLTAVARDVAGNTATSEAVVLTVDNDADLNHPRLLLAGGRLEDLRDRACYDPAGRPLTACPPNPDWTRFSTLIAPYLFSGAYEQMEAWHFALVYKITKNPAYAQRAIELAEAQINDGLADERSNEYEDIHLYLRNISLVYDWLNIFLDPAQKDAFLTFLNQVVNELWDPAANPYQSWSGRSINDPGSFRYYRFLLATAYAGLAAGSENPNPPELIFGGSTTTDLVQFVEMKVTQQAGPEWLDTNGKGAGWHEGDHFGLLATAALAELFNILKSGGASDYFSLMSFPSESVHYQLYSLQPGSVLKHPGGDSPDSPLLGVGDPDRHLMLLLADGLAGRPESEYSRYWLETVYTGLQSDWMAAWDFLLARPDLPARDFHGLPAAYYAEGLGWINSRSGWDDQAVSLSLISTDKNRDQQHFDQNSFVIFRSAWQAADANASSSTGLARATEAHNTLLVDGLGQREGDGTGSILKFESAAGYSYTVGEASDAYYLGTKNAGGQPLLSAFQREVVHILPGHIVVFDRVTPVNPQTVISYLLHTANQPVVDGARITATNGSGRLFQETVLPEDPAVLVRRELGGAAGLDGWRVEVSPAQPSAQVIMLNYLYATSSTVDSMPEVVAVSARTGNMVGAQIIDADQDYVVMFSPDPAGAPPTDNIIYDVGLNSGSRHILLGLLPAAEYSVSWSTVGGRQRVEVRPGQGYVTSASGRLEFELKFSPDRPVIVSGGRNRTSHPAGLTGAPGL